jgi:hypothetical protein
MKSMKVIRGRQPITHRIIVRTKTYGSSRQTSASFSIYEPSMSRQKIRDLLMYLIEHKGNGATK